MSMNIQGEGTHYGGVEPVSIVTAHPYEVVFNGHNITIPHGASVVEDPDGTFLVEACLLGQKVSAQEKDTILTKGVNAYTGGLFETVYYAGVSDLFHDRGHEVSAKGQIRLDAERGKRLLDYDASVRERVRVRRETLAEIKRLEKTLNDSDHYDISRGLKL